MKATSTIKSRLGLVLRTIFLIVVGAVIALGLIELLLRKNPGLISSEVRVNPPVRRVQAFIDESYDLRLSDGDLFYWMRGSIAPLPPDQDKVVAHVHMITDVHGFRNTPPERSAYSIVALGDSFTRASGVDSPWPQKLAELTGIDVLNLGDVGFGPQDELDMLQKYGLDKQPHWVVMAYFEGNDLYDAAAYNQANPFLLTRFVKYLLTQRVEVIHNSGQNDAHTKVPINYRYPITVSINDTNLEISFFSSYFSWLSISGDEIEMSQNYRILRETILKVRDLCEAIDSHFLLIYIPSKEHVYLQYVKNPEILANIFMDVPRIELDSNGFLQFTNRKSTSQLTFQLMNDQADKLADFARQQNIGYLDLTSAFQEVAGTGAELYYPFDTHWNQSGHNLAAQIIAEYVNKQN